MATYAPRTLLRLYNSDKTAHVTGVVLKDGKIYDTCNRQTYDSFDGWNVSRDQGGNMTIDASKAMGVVITNTHGFEYPTLNPYADWVFEILSELAPHLLANEAVRNAHQKFIDACKKPEVVIRMYGSCFFTGERKYRATLLNTCDQLYSLPFAYYTTYAYERRNMDSIQTAYMELRNLIADDLLPPLKVKEEHYKKIAGKRMLTRWMKMHERRIKKYAKIIKESQDYIEDYKKKLEAYM
jgi:hypothetical protein